MKEMCKIYSKLLKNKNSQINWNNGEENFQEDRTGRKREKCVKHKITSVCCH